MRIKFNPRVPLNSTDKIQYVFIDKTIQATLPDGTNDVFDFAGLPDGVLNAMDEETGESLIETTLSVEILKSAEIKEGVLSVELLNYIGLDATEKEKFPKWIDHTEYEAPEISEEEGGIPNGENKME